MKSKFSAWLVWLLFKLPIIRNIFKMRQFELSLSLRQNIEKMSDEDIDWAIKNMDSYDWPKEPHASVKAFCNNAGISLEVLSQWLKDEKFLREH